MFDYRVQIRNTTDPAGDPYQRSIGDSMKRTSRSIRMSPANRRSLVLKAGMADHGR